MNQPIFPDRAAAGRMLADRLRGLPLHDPVVLAIPRGGVETGAALARGLGCELDVVLARKLRAPDQPELAVGAVSEDGDIYLNDDVMAVAGVDSAALEAERRRQVAEIARRRTMFRAVRPQAAVRGRTVIVTDDGIATGATMIAALHSVRAAEPKEIIVAVPVGASGRIAAIRPLCDRLVCLQEPEAFWAVGQFYRDFEQVEDARVVELLRDHAWPQGGRRPAVVR
jgi:predicted phosphoribosyltransferase